MKYSTIIALFYLYSYVLFAQEIVENKNSDSDNKYITGLSWHERSNLLFGEPYTKVKFSFKYPSFNQKDLYLGYTQTIDWQIFKKSFPMYDIQFSPEIFYRLNFSEMFLRKLDISFFRHHSNGKSGSDSRSYNSSYVRGLIETHFNDELKFGLDIRGKLLHSKSANNKDIAKYEGPLDIEIQFSNLFQSLLEDEILYFNRKTGKKIYNFDVKNGGAWGAGLKWRFTDSKILPQFMLEYTYGYGNNLLEYNKLGKHFRFGFVEHF